MHVTAPSVRWSISLLHWTSGSKSSLCAYLHVLLCLQHIIALQGPRVGASGMECADRLPTVEVF